MKKTILSVCFLILLLINSTCASAQIKLSENELNQVNYVITGENEQALEEDSILRTYLHVELIDQKIFESKHKSAISLFVSDPEKFKKQNGVIQIPLGKGFKKFEDDLALTESREEYNYIGQIPFLNAYVIHGLYWEEADYLLFDKNTGEELTRFVGFPYLSADKKHIIGLYDNRYEKQGEIEFYTLSGVEFGEGVSIAFKNWMPAVNVPSFWSAEGDFYAAILPSKGFWKKDGNVSDAYQYVKIRIL